MRTINSYNKFILFFITAFLVLSCEKDELSTNIDENLSEASLSTSSTANRILTQNSFLQVRDCKQKNGLKKKQK